MKLLVVMSSFPEPPGTGSSIVANNALRQLAARHEIHFVCARRFGEDGGLAKQLASLHVVGSGGFSELGRRALLLSLLRRTPPPVTRVRSRAVHDKIAELDRAHHFDAIVLFELWAIQYIPEELRHKTLANIEDPQALRLELIARLPIWSARQRVRQWTEARVMASYERRVLPSLGRTLLLSEADVATLRARSGYRNLACMTYAVDVRPEHELVPQAQRDPGRIVYSGNMFHPSNVDGALFLLERIFARVLEGAPAAKLWIVGARTDPRIRRAAERFGERAVITGKVPDIAEYVRTAVVSVCPMRVEIGVQTKILEAFSVGTPVVSTHAGNSGIGGVSGEHLWMEDAPERFAERTVSLLRGEHWQRLADNGRELSLARFTWERSARMLEEQIEAIRERADIRTPAR